MTAWAQFRAWCHRPIDARPAALVRILLPLVVVADHVRAVARGLYPELLRDPDHGGIFPPSGSPWYVLDDLLGPVHAGPVAAVVSAGALLLAALGIAPRVALVVGVFAWAQLGHGFPHSDNGGDRIGREVLLLLALSGAGRCWALGGTGERVMPAWPVDLVRWLLVFVYVGAGTTKVFPRPSLWLGFDHSSVTYRILAAPVVSRFDPHWNVPALMHALDWATVGIEVGAVLLLTRWRAWWALCAAPIHLGIALFMDIDTFGWTMLAIYPLLFDRWLVAALDRAGAVVGGQPPSRASSSASAASRTASAAASSSESGRRPASRSRPSSIPPE